LCGTTGIHEVYKATNIFFCFWDSVKSQPVYGDLRIKIVVYGEYNELVLMGFIQFFLVDISFLFKWGYSGIYSYILYMMYTVSVQYTSMRLSIQGSKKMVVETSNSLGFKQPQNGGLNSHQNGDYTIKRRDFANEQIWDLLSFVLIVPHVFSNSIFFFVIFREHPEFIDHFLGTHGVSISNHGVFHSFFHCFSGFFPYFP
jgi:hypothetical protein